MNSKLRQIFEEKKRNSIYSLWELVDILEVISSFDSLWTSCASIGLRWTFCYDMTSFCGGAISHALTHDHTSAVMIGNRLDALCLCVCLQLFHALLHDFTQESRHINCVARDISSKKKIKWSTETASKCEQWTEVENALHEFRKLQFNWNWTLSEFSFVLARGRSRKNGKLFVSISREGRHVDILFSFCQCSKTRTQKCDRRKPNQMALEWQHSNFVSYERFVCAPERVGVPVNIYVAF